ncbi:MAG: cytochrome c [Myxococcota bacterium]|jgi:cytochrome c oxidase cbb3-type subunit III|nr:cytochrome c [Myxococcota bacterium]
MSRGMFLALLLSCCHEEDRVFREGPPAPAPSAPTLAIRESNAWSVAEGKRLFSWYNCVGCHSNGGGGMGPALMDAAWLYGSEPEAVYSSIAHGRPRGMPAFGSRVPEQELWQLVAYVRSLASLVPAAAAPGRNDSIGGLEPESQLDPPELRASQK